MRVNNPSIPYKGPIHGGLRPGMSVYFKGTVHRNISRFHINLQCQCNRALHFNPRFKPSEMVVFNTFRRRRWECEERVNEMPFRRGEGFELVFIIKSEGFQVNVNGQRLYVFKHRMPVQRVTGLQIAGDVSMETVIIQEGEGGLQMCPSGGKFLSIPYVQSIPGGLRLGMSVCFKGTVQRHINRFHINLQDGETKGCVKAMHFNPRFKPHEVVVFNTFRHGWGHEERVREMPFCKGEDFVLIFIVTSEGYQVNINGTEFYLFKHRIPVEQVSAIKIAGDVSMKTIDINRGGEEGLQICPSVGKILWVGLTKLPWEALQGADAPDGIALRFIEPHRPFHHYKTIPYLRSINDSLRIGMSVYFKGHVHHDISRFHINLQHGPTKALTAMHFNPRFRPHEVVVFNTFRKGRWEKEEKVKEMPFSKETEFELLFIVTSEGYQVKVNGAEFYLFKHRIPVEKVNAIKIGGDVSLQTVDIIGEKEGAIQFCPNPPAPKKEIFPNVEPIYGGLRTGMSVYFKGSVPKEINRFSINLHCGEVQGCDNAFHFNPRFEPSEVVVFNTFRNGSWETEERVTEMPFLRGEDFVLVFIVTSEGYQVNVNDQQLYMFKHRLPVEDVTAIKIFGDISMEIVNIIEGGEGCMQGQLSLGKVVVPKTPYATIIHGGLREGMYLYFRGTMLRKINRFQINLQYGQKKGLVKAMHFNPRFKPSQLVVFNTLKRSGWQKEEKVCQMPFCRGEDFEVLFIVTAKGYQVNINGRPFYLYKHHVPLQHVNIITVSGDVSMEAINIIGGGKEGIQGYRGLRKMVVSRIPHVGPIYGGLRTGMYLYFRGTVPNEINRFHVNLQFGEMKGCNKALHFNPRFKPSEVVVLNSFKNGRWEKEERVNKMPFRKGENFELLFIITTDGYQVNVNGRQFYFFKHRMPVEHVSAINIAGDVSMQTVNMIRGVQGALDGHPSLGKMVVTKIPHVGPVYGGLRKGMAVFFRGTVPHEINRFHINLQYGELKGCDKALHFNPRFTPSEVVVFNTSRNGSWDKEERVDEMPFHKGEEFELAFIITSEGYQVIVNGRRFYMFRHRMPVEQVSALKIAGDVSMQTVNVIEAGKVGTLAHPGLGKMEVSSIPFVGPIHGCLRTGIYMYFRGSVSQDIKRFHINLQYGEMKGCDKALHFNPRFKPHEVVVFNTFRNGNWQKEERVHKMPFRKGESFEVVFIVTPKGYQVIANGRPLHFFKHRMPVEQVSALKIAGDVSMLTVNMIEGGQGHAGQGKMVVTSIPHVGPIYGGLRTGMFMFFRGTVAPDSNRFHINLQYGELKGCDKALHFNPRFQPSEVVVFNTFRNGSWEKEERVHEMPFRKGEDFELAFIITPKGYQVLVNGRQFYLFKHRMPVEHVSAIKIAGDVSMQDVNMTGGEDDQEGHPGIRRMVISGIPHVGHIHRGLRKGMALHFQGTIPDEINRFHINLQYGEMKGCDKALHFNPRFDPSEVVVFNTFRKGSWEKEERVHKMPFSKGESFELVFIITSEGYQVIVNGEKFYLFRHRMPVEHVNALRIAGDVSMETVDMNKEDPGEPQEQPDVDKEVVRSIPHVGPIYGGLRTGISVYFKGTIPEKINRFSINLHCGEVEGCDNAFHFNPRFEPSEVVVFNTFRNGSWENEERVNKMPFRKGENFELLFIVTSEGYQVNVNGKEFYLFKHRMPVEEASAIKIFGDVSVQTINLIEGGQEGIQAQLCLGNMVVNTIPYMGPIYSGLRTGMYLYFRGTVHDDINRFHINLQYGEKKGSEKALHFNPRFQPSEVVVFNTFQNGQWQKEERVHEMPFRKGEKFGLVFIINSKGYQVIVNGRRFYMFKHRLPVEQVSTLAIGGDVSMETVNMIGEGQGCIQGYRGLRKMVITRIPHVAPVYGGLRTGMYLYFRGTLPQMINRFHINLQYGEMKGCDTALHFNPRFKPSEVVVFNTFRNGKWEKEERVREMPFHKGQEFEMVFIITSEGYQVIVNGRRFYLFRHRMPVEHVGALAICGDVSMQTVNMIRGGQGCLQGNPSLGKMVVTSIPHVGPVYGGLRTGMYLYFNGTVPQEIKRFSINLQYGEMKGCDKALHFNPRFEPSEVVVFNTFRNGSWETEERVDEMPFSKGENFELVFIITSEGYQVNVNGHKFYLFKHRMPVEHVNAMKIAGDVSMQNVNMTERGEGDVQELPDEEKEEKKEAKEGLEKEVNQGKMLGIPHVQSIPDGLRTGMYLYFKGTVPQDTKRFHINLQSGETKGCDKAIHFNPRFKPSEVVVFNTFRNGKWENEERVNEMPFHEGGEFELVFFVTSEGYQVIVNGRQFYLFKHRMPVEHVNALKVAGNISMEAINIIGGGPGGVQGQPGLEKVVVTKIPHVGPIFGFLRTGMYLYFRGTVPQESNRFHINLQYGQMNGSDIAMHFNPRFTPGEVVVFNTFQKGSWEKEMQVHSIPFRRGEDFELVFIITSAGYMVMVNGRPYHLFEHRIPVQQVSAVEIAGDVSVQTINTIRRGPRGTQGQPGLGKTVISGIPHMGPIYGGLRHGMALYFVGTIPQGSKRFHINLQFGESKGCDKALHFNPRFEPSEVVVFNTFQSGMWQTEDRVTEMPFTKGEKFELVFIVTSEGYQVIVNGRRFHLFRHRKPAEHVTALKVAGDVSMETIDITERGEGDVQELPDEEKEEKKVDPSIPHVGPIYGGLRPGMSLYFCGTIPQEINRFSINLHCGEDNSCDNAFHFNPRFEPSEVVVFNTFRNGSWEKEERVDVMPFERGEEFEMVINVTLEGYQVNVNDSEFYLFKHRIKMEDVTAIKIFGDVHIQTTNIIEGGKGAVQGRLGLGKMVVDSIPFVGHIHRGLRTGMYLYFRGTVHHDITRFHINLQCGEMKGCAKALHFNPHFQPSEAVVFNTFQNGKWQKEERVGDMPFRQGEEFELVIIITSKGYQVIINGRRFYMFKHRMPVEQVTAIQIDGDVSMETINIIGGDIQGYRSLRKMLVTSIPHVGPVYGGLRTGMYVYFRGTVPQDINRFHINLQYGEMKGCDKALHFNPRFTPSEMVVFNTFRKGKWEKEERVNKMPFSKGGEFELVFIITSEGYQVLVNGRRFYMFRHRMPVQHVSAIKIAGDVTMQHVNMIRGGEGGMPGPPGLGKMVITSNPHVGPVYGGLRSGMYLIFKGTIPQEIKRFHINLQYGELKGCDKAIHFNPRFEPSEVVVFNTFRNGSWEDEERVDKMPFSKGENFELVFIITSEGYQVNVNGRQFYLFKHRMPVEHVSAIKISGDVSMHTVNMIAGGKGVCPGVPRLPGAGPVVVSTTPHVEPIDGGLRTGMYLYFKGTIPQEIKSFAINLQYGEIKGCDKALHFNPRFEPSKVVVFNSFRNGSWETEEGVDEMPFHKGENFEMVFIITSEGYQVNINGRQFHFFKHRMPVEQVSALKIVGDVSMQDINMTEGGPGSIQGLPGQGKIVISSIPHVVPTYGGLRTGIYLYFKGTVPEEIKSFAINLQYGEIKGCDKALHFNPRFEPSEVVVFNSFRNGSWGTEEKVEEMPFIKGEEFEIVFIITPEGYQVNINGRQFYFFKHRMPVEQLCALKISGDVSMQTLNMIEGVQGGVEGSPGQGKIVVTSIPHVGPIYGGLRPGMALYFQGTIPEEMTSFAINLQYGEMKGCDKAFHFNPRFEPSEMVAFNSFRNCDWEEEESVDKMPFEQGKSFEMVFIITSEGYQVIVNGRRFYLFKHRMPVEQVSALRITGSIFIETVNIIGAGDVEIQEKPDEEKEEAESIPDVEPISGGLKTGMAAYFKGTIPNEISSFAIDLQCGEAKGCDTAFRFNPQFEPSEAVVFNSFKDGSWETEERVTEMPFEQGESFELMFLVTSEGYQVFVNGHRFYLFKHRIPVDQVCSVQITGEVSMQTTNYLQEGEVDIEEEPDVDDTEVTQTVTSLPGGLKTGMSMSFQGMIPNELTRFSIDLQCGEGEGCDTALHFSPQFTPSEGVVFNSFKNGSWEQEERVTEMPFRRGESFLLVFILTSEGYQVFVNGQQLYLFKYRMAVEQVSAIRIIGDVSMQAVNMTEVVEEEEEEEETETVQSETPIPGSLKTGMTLSFQGAIPDESTRFSINMQCGETEGCDTAFHFSPQFETSDVVFNTFRNGSWEKEERVNEMPFRKGEKFEIVYIITSDGYQVNVNGTEFYLFKHRIPLEQVRALQIAGDVSIQTTNIIEETVQEYPSPAELGTVQSETPIPGSLKTGMSLSFQGMIPEETTRFSINMQCGETEGCDTAFHFSPQFETSDVVFNTFRNGSWEKEERVNEMPFRKGEKFEIVYIITSDGYQVNVNGTEFYLFKHRIPLEQVRALQIAGDVSIQTTNIIEETVQEYRSHADFGTVQSETPIPGSLKTGMSLSFQGMIPEETTRFSINMQCGETEGCDTAFHFSPQFETSDVVFNTFRNGSWEKEERVNEMPFRKGEKFEIVYIITSDGYQVNVNGTEFYLFKHRIPLEQVRALQIAGDVSIQTTNIIEETVQEYRSHADFGTVQSETPIPGNLKTGMSLSFQGMIPEETTRFSINMQCGETEGCDTAFHFSPQFETSDVVFNTFRNGSWEKEERVNEMPFRKGEKFEIVYIITSDGYQVNVNGTEFYLFKHRIPLEQVRALQIAGDVSIQTTNIIEETVQEYRSHADFGTVQSETPIPGSLKTGMSLSFQGMIPEETTRFSINMQCGETEGCDTAFHFSPQFDTSDVVFNTFRNGSWEKEERVNEMPFRKGEKFEIVYIITSDGYQVNVNGTEFYLFKHRIPLEQVRALQIAGDVSIQTTNIIEETVQEYRSHADFGTVQSETPIPGSLKTGMSLSFQGMIPEETTRFSINMQCGETEGCDTAFHFSPQFDTSDVVFNTFRNGSWEKEERVNEMPFRKGEKFEIVYIITSDGYQVNVNGTEFYLFKHRIPLEQVRALQITGDVSIQTTNIIEETVQEYPSPAELGTVQSVTPIPGSPKTGMMMSFEGTIPHDITRFSINLQCGETDGCDTALHFGPQFEPSEMVVFNTFQNGNWKEQERVEKMPFRKGERFLLVFNINPEGYEVLVNDSLFYMFRHRIPVEQVRALQIIGDVCIQAINIIESIPSVTPLPGSLKMGTAVSFRGTIPSESTSFSIDLQCGETEGCDKALHFNPRFTPSGVVVFNSFRNGSWENEERVTEMPFRRGEDFELVFIITSEGYQVYVNGQQFYVFKHRIPVEQVRALQIAGNVTVPAINITEGGLFGMQATSDFKKVVVTSAPYVVPMPGGLKPGTSVNFQGAIPQEIPSFSINLQCGEGEGCNTALHFSPQFTPSEVVVFNSFNNGSWEMEERVTQMPFRKGEKFVLVFNITSEGYQVNVNGSELYLFKHRLPMDQVSAMQIVGDVSVTTINIIEGAVFGMQTTSGFEQVVSAPYVVPMPGGVKMGTSVNFQVSIPQEIPRFSIDLQCGEADGCDTALHLNPQFEPSEVVVFNSFKNGSWEEEERVTEMPFHKGESCELAFDITSEGYQVKVNGAEFYLFKHRIPVEKVSALKIAGDVTVQSVNIIEGGVLEMQGSSGFGQTVTGEMGGETRTVSMGELQQFSMEK